MKTTHILAAMLMAGLLSSCNYLQREYSKLEGLVAQDTIEIVDRYADVQGQPDLVMAVGDYRFGTEINAKKKVLDGQEVGGMHFDHVCLYGIPVAGTVNRYELVAATLSNEFFGSCHAEAQKSFELLVARYARKYSNLKQVSKLPDNTAYVCGTPLDGLQTFDENYPIRISLTKSVNNQGLFSYCVKVEYYSSDIVLDTEI